MINESNEPRVAFDLCDSRPLSESDSRPAAPCAPPIVSSAADAPAAAAAVVVVAAIVVPSLCSAFFRGQLQSRMIREAGTEAIAGFGVIPLHHVSPRMEVIAARLDANYPVSLFVQIWKHHYSHAH